MCERAQEDAEEVTVPRTMALGFVPSETEFAVHPNC
jgi:hypothetical protein